MKNNLFFKCRQVWLPTFLGSILIIVVSLLIIMLALKNLAMFLAYDDPVEGRYLVVEGWVGKSALLEAINTFKTGQYQYVITTGGSENWRNDVEFESYAKEAATFLVKSGLDKSKLIILPTPDSAQDRTFLSAVIVREWFEKNSISVNSLDVFSGDVHARRTHVLYKMAFGNDIKIGIIAAEPDGFELQYWWKKSSGAKSVVTELVGLLWVKCCFFPGKYGSHQEKWGIY